MWNHMRFVVWYIALGSLLLQIGQLGDCLRKVQNVSLQNARVANEIRPLGSAFRFTNITPISKSLKPSRNPFCAAIVKTAVQRKRVNTGILSLLSHSYNAIKSRVANKVVKLLENRKQALSSTHPLRHQRWEIELQRKTGILGISYETEKLTIDFMEDGSLTTSKGQKGQWWSEFGDVVWKIYFDPSSNVATYFNAQFCWNYFGESAFMRRGVVYQDRPPTSWIPQYLFRPVLGKFTGHGVP